MAEIRPKTETESVSVVHYVDYYVYSLWKIQNNIENKLQLANTTVWSVANTASLLLVLACKFITTITNS